jgi:hypothetical protein
MRHRGEQLTQRTDFRGNFTACFELRKSDISFLYSSSFSCLAVHYKKTGAFSTAVCRRPIKFNDKYAIVSWIIFFIVLLLVYF